MKKIHGNTYIEVYVECPECNYSQDRFDDLHDYLEDDHRAHGINVELICKNCKEKFIVEQINY